MAESAGARVLDFIVIGAQKGGTTSLWQYLRHHPSIWMPAAKEEPFFCFADTDRPGAFAAYMDAHFATAPEGSLLGKATPLYMMGLDQVDVERIAERISCELPRVRLIALLRDPIERAASHYRMSVRRGWEERSFEAAVADQLDPEREAEAGRAQPTETNSYVAQGEYGRILGIYRSRFPTEQLHVELTEDLNDDPGAVIDRVLEFLGLPPGYRPARLDARLHRGGSRKLLDQESEVTLFEFMDEHVWPKLGADADATKRLFDGFFEIWNIAPEEPLEIEQPTRARLMAHYEADAERLAALGVPAPWVRQYSRPS